MKKKMVIIFNDTAIVSVKENDYRINFWYISKYGAMNIMTNSYLKQNVDHCKNTKRIYI